jgi:signal transduction histidine kinase/HAMP domain-containing protein
VKLSQRLLAGFLAVIAVLTVLVVVSVDRRVRERLRTETSQELLLQARLIADQWRPGVGADSLADAAGALLGRRVTLIQPDGVVAGDSEFDGPALGRLENHRERPEVAAAQREGAGTAIRRSPSTSNMEIYGAVRAETGTARVSMSTGAHDIAVLRVQRDVLSAAAVAALVALVLSFVFARSVSRPLAELTDDARAIAAGDLARRPSISAPGEVGDLATAFHRLGEQLSARVKALEDDDTLLRALTESLNEGVVALDARERVQHINERGRELLGVRDALPFDADRLPRDRLLRDALASALRGAAIDNVETTIHERSLALTGRPLAGGGAVLALFDVTPIRRLEVVRRDFVANVSHELKTPITIVGGFAETLRDDSATAEQKRQFADAIVANARRMHRLVDDLLDLSRIESGGWRPNPAVVDIAQVAGEVLAPFAAAARAKGVRLTCAPGADAGHLLADPVAFRQVLTNLVDNALRHTPSGEVGVSSERAAEGVVVTVRDTGIGIAAEHLPRIFERFYRVDASRSRQEGGTGLGLAIVRHLVEAHGGRVSAESTLGRGTTVRAHFPGAAADA